MSRSETWTQTDGCKRCQEHPERVCVACTQRRRRAAQLREQDGLTVEQIATRMRLAVPRVQRLLEEEDQYRDLQQYRGDRIAVDTVQALLKQRQAEDPALTQQQIATAAGYGSRIALLRAIGLEPTAKTVRRGKEYPPELRSSIDVDGAGRIVRALGFAPHEIPWL